MLNSWGNAFVALLLACAPAGVPLRVLGQVATTTPGDCGCEAPAPLQPDSHVNLLKDKRAEALPPRPNIVLLVSDDVDREWVGSYRRDGQSVTPHLDRIAKQGARFESAYAAASTCAPSRYALFTGRWPSRAVATATFARDILPNVKLPDDCEAHHRVNGTVVDPGEPNLVFELRALGYHSAFIGKWHCSSEIAMMHSPLRDKKALYAWMQAQVHSRGYHEADGLYFTNVPQLRSKLGSSVQHHQEWLTQLAVDYIRRRGKASWEDQAKRPGGGGGAGAGSRRLQEVSGTTTSTATSTAGSASGAPSLRRPFFLTMASTLPHGPDLPLWPKENDTLTTVSGDIVPPTQVAEIRRKRQAALARCAGIEIKNGFDQMVKYRHQSIRWLVQYIPLKGNDCAKLALFDDAVGEIVGALKETGQLKDTLLIYTTDHGWTDKGFAYEGGCHVPLLMQWPRFFGPNAGGWPNAPPAFSSDNIKQSSSGLVLPALVSTIDVAATALEAASRGMRATPNSMDGVSLLHLLAPTSPATSALDPTARMHRDFTYIANGLSRAVVSHEQLKLVRAFFPRNLNRQWSREAGGVRVNPHFGPGCVHDWWATAVTKHGNFFDRHQFFDLTTDRFEQRSLYRALKTPPGKSTAGNINGFPSKTTTATSSQQQQQPPATVGVGGVVGGGRSGLGLATSLEAMYEALLNHTKVTKKCAEVCAVQQWGSAHAESTRKVHLKYLAVLNLRNESRNFLTNWFQWTEKYRAAGTRKRTLGVAV